MIWPTIRWSDVLLTLRQIKYKTISNQLINIFCYKLFVSYLSQTLMCWSTIPLICYIYCTADCRPLWVTTDESESSHTKCWPNHRSVPLCVTSPSMMSMTIGVGYSANCLSDWSLRVMSVLTVGCVRVTAVSVGDHIIAKHFNQ